MKKRKIAAAIAAMVMAATAIQTLSASAIGYVLPKVEDVDKYIEEFASNDEVSKLLEEYYATLEKGDDGIIHILKLPITKTIHSECPNGVYWAFKEYYAGSTRVLSPEQVIDPAYYQDFINEDILSVEEFNKMSYEEKIVFTVNYYLEHGEYLTMWAAEESDIGFTSMPPDDNETLMGDVDMDGKITAFDAACVLTEYSVLSAGSESSLNANQKLAADVDNDGKVTAFDAAKILNYYAELAAEREPSRD